MAYSTTLQFAQRSGLGLRIVDENVGTGDNLETDFDLDFDNVITGSYVLSHAVSSSNNFTALIETTHYTLDKESGRIILTAAGLADVGTDVIYATYWYVEGFSDSVISNLISAADDEIDQWTGRKWDTPTSVTEYVDGRPTLGYPTTDNPYVSDYDQPDGIVLKNRPPTLIEAVYFLQPILSTSQFWNYDAASGDYTDRTTAVNSFTEAPFILFDDAPATNDIIYIGSSNIFLGMTAVLSTLGVDNGNTAIDWEYWNGTAWTDLTETDVDTGASIFTASGSFTWTYPYGWVKTTVNSSSSLYFIRGTLSDGYGTYPQLAALTLIDGVSEIVELRNLALHNGRVNFISKSIPAGTRNVRIDYKYGYATTPTYIAEVSMLLASLQAFINLSGGSYNDATSYSLGSKSVTIGEVYVNIREVINQFKGRIDGIYAMVGKRINVAAI
jgi:hypothetical protein